MKRKIHLSELASGERCVVASLSCCGAIRRRFSDLGILPGVEIECIGKSPLGNPVAYLVRGKSVAIRKEGASGIDVYIDIQPES